MTEYTENKPAEHNPNIVPPDYPAELAWPLRWVLTDVSFDRDYYFWEHGIHKTKKAARLYVQSIGSYGGLIVAPLTWAAEQTRVVNDAAAPVWSDQPWWNTEAAIAIRRHHFVSVSENDPTLLAYVQDARKGQRGIRTPIKPGRYLAKFFGAILSEKEIAYAAAWQATGCKPDGYGDESCYKLAFATTREEVKRVYLNGPPSCMSNGQSHYDSKNVAHPSEVYAAGDLAVAYLADGAGNIVARAVAWPARKTFGRVYPTPGAHGPAYSSTSDAEDAHNALRDRLKRDGYASLTENPEGFDGARLLALEVGCGKYVMPYMDNGLMFRWHESEDGRFQVCFLGGTRAEDTGGVTRINGREEDETYAVCERCGDGIEDEDDAYLVVSHMRNGRSVGASDYCPYCLANHTFYCNGINETVSDDIGWVMIDDESYSVPYAEGEGYFYCDHTDEYRWGEAGQVEVNIRIRDSYSGRTRRALETWCQDAFDADGFTCPVTGETWSKESGVYVNGIPDMISPDAADDETLIADYIAEHAPNGIPLPEADGAPLLDRIAA
jgi:hypothetical protein